MISPIEFYRKLDDLLTRIANVTERKDFLFSIVSRLQETFGSSLHFKNGNLYEEGADRFYLLSDEKYQSEKWKVPDELLFESPAIQQVMKHGCYIYDDPALKLMPQITRKTEYAIPVATLVRGSEKRWLLVYELTDAWVREEIQFCFNMVRRALEFRLYYEGFKSNLLSAARIQQSLLPREVPQIPGFQMAARSQAAELVGGDLYDFFAFDNSSFGLAIGDAVGHDLPAALLVRDVVTGLRMGIEKEMKITYTFKKLNRIIHRSLYASGYISLFYAEIEENGSLFYVNAGHPAPLLIWGEQVKMLEANAPIIGPLPEIKPKRGYINFPPGAVLVLYTDGIFERRNPKGENFSIERLQKIASQNQEKSAEDILEILFDQAFAFGEKQAWEDDVSIVVVKRL